MKILYILNVANRVNNFCMTSLIAAKKLNIEYHIAGNWGYENDSELKQDEKKHDIRIHQVDFNRSPFSLKNRKAYQQLKEIVSRENFDAIHCNTPIGGLLGRLVGKKYKVKNTTYQAHGFHFYKGAPKKNWLLYYPVEKWLARYTDAIITINKEDYELAKTKLKLRKNGKVYYVPGVGIDTAQYTLPAKVREEKRTELGIPHEAFLLISVGELNKNKNNSVIISAMEKLQNKNIHYILCGVGEKQAELQDQADKAGLHNNVHFLGYRNDVKELYQAADCFVMPSFREGLSRSIMEAMASGLPCVVSKIRGNTDLIDGTDGGYLCETTDVSAYAEKLNLLANDKALREKMGRNNLITIKKFSTETVTEEIRKIYESEFADNVKDLK